MNGVYRSSSRGFVIFFELPFMVNNHSSKKGDVVKLSIACGLMLAYYQETVQVPVPVINWKGTMTDQMTGERIRKHLKKDYPDHKLQTTTQATHELDACGIGMYVKGEF